MNLTDLGILRSFKDVWPLAKRFLPYIRRVREQAVLVGALELLSPVVSIAALWLMKFLIDEVFVAGHINLLPKILAAYVALVSFQIVISYAITRVESAVVTQITQDVGIDLYRHLISSSPGSFHKKSVGDLLAHFSGDVDHVEYLIYSGPLRVVSNLVSAIFYIVFLLFLSWKLTVCALLALPLITLVTDHFAPLIRRASRISRHKAAALMSLAEERLGAVPLVQAFGTQDAQMEAFMTASSAARKAELRGVAIQARLSLFVEATAALGGLVVLGLGAYEMYQGNLTIGALLAFLGSVGSLYSPVRSLAKTSGRFQRTATSAQRVAELLDVPSLVRDSPTATPLARTTGRIEFRQLRFGYPSGPEVLHGVSLCVEPGETLAIVGPNGGGKSTLIQLAIRLYDPGEGAVFLDGRDIREITLESLRRAVTIVFQEPYIVRGTIRDNVQSGGVEGAPEQFIAAAQAAHIEAFAGVLPARYSAPVGPRGAWLSDGQRQRIALARALYRNAPILLLDEATSLVDSETEELMQEAIDRLSGRRTILLVGHRLSTVQRADRVVVLENGNIVEVGSPGRLLALGTRYRELFDAQVKAAAISA